jgi:hypothetical protein
MDIWATESAGAVVCFSDFSVEHLANHKATCTRSNNKKMLNTSIRQSINGSDYIQKVFNALEEEVEKLRSMGANNLQEKQNNLKREEED